ncbi:SDR family oxidoreductase [Novosphingobium sp.]|uniref:SDR family oxidoreductase n=1 Tax=Novosphingobium sp. TaxID=1874826 RepID=UPI0031CFD660
MTISLSGQSVLIVGAGGGVGRAALETFARQGAIVTAAGRPGDALSTAAAAAGVAPTPLDFLDNDAVEAFFAAHAPFDHVVIAAASTKSGSVAGLDLDAAKAAMESKFWGAYRVARAAKVNPGGSITLVSGFLSHRPSAGAVLQGAINAALEALGRGLALERAPVRVNTVSPGLVNTPLWQGMSEEARDGMFERTAARLPAGRIGQPEDIASAILFVATNPFATGSTITVDGGGTIA